jgi:hypothetical protein
MIINCQFLPATILLSFQVYLGPVWIQNQASLPHQQSLLLTRKWSTTFASTGHTQKAFWIFLDLVLFQNPAFHAHKQSLTQLLFIALYRTKQFVLSS